VTGEEETDGVEWTRPVVMNMETERFWLPPVNGPSAGCDLPVWSPAVQRLVTYDGESVLVINADGSQDGSYSGSRPLDLSPSGNRVIAGKTWIDLKSRQVVEFSRWAGTISTVYPPAWTADETRVFACCYSYGDAVSGSGESFDLNGMLPVGRGLAPGFPGIPSYWMLDDSFATILWDFFSGQNFGIMPLIDPVGRNYQDLRGLTGIRSDSDCSVQSVSPDKKHAWISCQSDAFWLDFADFRTLAFPPSVYIISWSGNGSFAVIGSRSDPSIQVLSATDGNAQPLPDLAAAPAWNPKESTLAYLSNEGQTLNVQNLDTQVLRQLSLPGQFTAAFWNPGGDALALLSKDGSIWLALYPSLDRAAQIAPPASGVRDLQWSPSGVFLAYVSGQDILIIKTP
jgi:WD40 repeat protein